MRLQLAKQGDVSEQALKQFMVEDAGSPELPSYVDFVCKMHHAIQSEVS